MGRLGSIAIGTAGWNVPGAYAAYFPGTGSHLQRYGRRLSAVEINTSFYRPHRVATYERWAASVPDGFRFAVKIPRVITQERRLIDAGEPLARFLCEGAGLGSKLGPLLLQLPPSLAFDRGPSAFLAELRRAHPGTVVCEPRHPTWFTPEVDALLDELSIARVAADPAPVRGADEPGGWRGLTYYRLHGSPKIYYSAYGPAALDRIAARLAQDASGGREVWCIFDNTAEFAATGNAIETDGLVRRERILPGSA
ncbi:DUF72 domain-containing protein [uncultured Methylobacterium sp.]|uniref:DUF72 domain-containing protein n=1 Tax=uncultured Methylobacterium sp. TaxID=157278 RepID=UPI0035CB4EB0